MNEKSRYRKCYKKFAFNNLLYTHFKSKAYRKKIIRFEKLSKNKKISHNSTLTKKSILTKESFIIRKLKLIELITSFTFSNEMSFHFQHYLIDLFNFFKNALFESDCFDTKYFMNINNRLFLKRLISFLIIKKHKSTITLREIDFNRHFF